MKISLGLRWGSVMILTIAGIIVALLSPSERVLGDSAKLIYVHGALVWVSLVMFTITEGFGVVHLIHSNVKEIIERYEHCTNY